MENDGTYGGISRSKSTANLNNYYTSPGVPITLDTLRQGFEAIRRMDEATSEWEKEFYAKMRPHAGLAMTDIECYCALYRLYQSSRSPISQTQYDQLMGIVKSRGIEL